MKLSVKEFNAVIEIKNKGIEIDVYDENNVHLGDLVVAKSGITWCAGKTSVKNGIKVPWKKFIALMGSQK